MRKTLLILIELLKKYANPPMAYCYYLALFFLLCIVSGAYLYCLMGFREKCF